MIGIIIGIAAGFVGVLLAVIAVLYAAGLIKKGFRHSEPAPGVKPVAKKILKALLLKLNNPRHPFTVKTAQDTDLYVEWIIVDAKWIEVLGTAYLNKMYTLWVLLDETIKTVRVNELITEKSITAGSTGFHGETSFFRGVQLWRKEQSRRFGIKSDFSIGEVYKYTFNPDEMKDIVRQVANDNGWAFELVVTKNLASFSKN